MSAVDERVVEMRFDNKQFEKNIKDSIKSLDDLDRQLGLLDENESFENIEKSSKKLNFSRLVDGVGELGDKFNWLEKIATGALFRIGSKITDLISNYAGQLSFKQIAAGWNKYGEYSTATQTTIAATYDTWKDEADGVARLDKVMGDWVDKDYAQKVYDTFESFEKGEVKINKAADALQMSKEKALATFDEIRKVGTELTHEQYVEQYIDRLNKYSDETSYNFTDMVSTLSKFTAAGQTLKDSTKAIQGMMNMVAMAGGNAAVGQRVSYNLSQAMGVGALTSIDFRSLENANVATVSFKEHLLETAEALGVIDKVSGEGADAVYKYEKATFSATEGFRDSLSEKWITSDVLQKTLEEYGAFSEKIFDLSDEYGMEVRDALDEVNAYQAAMSEDADPAVVDEWHKHIQDMFGDDVERAQEYEKVLAELGSEDMEFSKRAFLEAQAAKTFRDAIDATADAVSTKWMNIFKYVFGSSERAKEFWTDFCDTLYDIFAAPLDDILELFKAVKENGQVWDIDTKEIIDPFEAIRRSLGFIQDALINIITPIREAFNEVFLSNAAENITSLSLRFLTFTRNLAQATKSTDGFKNAFKTLFGILNGVRKVIGGVFKIVKPLFGLIAPVARLIGTIASSLFHLIGALLGLNEYGENIGFVKFIDSIADAVGNAVSFISGALDALTDWIGKHINLEEAQKKFQDLKNVLVKVWGDIKKAVSGAWDKIKEFLHIDDVTAAVDSFWQTVKGFLPSWEELLAGLQAGWETFKQVGMAIWNFISPYLAQLWNSLKTLWGHISKYIDGFLKAENKWQYIKNNIVGIVDAFLEWKRNSKFINFIIKSFDKLKDALKKVKDAFTPKEGEEGGLGSRLFGLAYLAASFAALFLILRNVDRITKGFESITKAIKKFSGFLNKVALFVGIYLVVKAVTDLVKAMTLFGLLPVNRIIASTAAVTVLLGVLGAFGVLVPKFIKGLSNNKVKSFQRIFLTLAAVLLAIAGAIFLVSISPGTGADVAVRVGLLAGVISIIVGLVYVLTKMKDKIDLKAIGAIVALGAVLLVAAIAIEKLAKIPPTELQTAIQIILAIAGAVIVAMVIGNFLNKGSEAIKNIGFAVAALAAAMLLIVISLDKLQGISFSWGTLALILTIVSILAILSAIPVVITRYMKDFSIRSKDMAKVGTVIASLTACILVIAITIGLLAKSLKKNNVAPKELLSIGAVLMGIMLMLGLMVLAMGAVSKWTGKIDKHNVGLKKIASAIRSIVGSIVILTAAMVILTKLNLKPEDLSDAFGIVALVGVFLTILIFVVAWSSKIAGKDGLKAAPIVAMVLGIIAIVGAIVVLNKLLQNEGNKLWQATVMILAVVAIIGVMFLAVGGATRLAGEKGLQLGPIIAIFAGLSIILAQLMMLAAFEDSSPGALKKATVVLLAIAGSIAVLMLCAGIMQKLSGSWGNMGRSIIMLAAVVLAIVVLANVMKQLQGVDVATKTVLQMGLLLAGLLTIVTLLGWLATVTGAGLGVIALAAGLVLIAAAIGILAIAINIAVLALPAFAAGMQKVFDVISGIGASTDQLDAFVRILKVLAVFGTVAMIGMGVGALIMAAGFYVGAQALAIVSGILPELSEGLLKLVTTLGMIAPVMGPVLGAAGKLVLVFLALMVGGIMLGAGLAVAGIGLGIVGGAAMILATAIGIASLAVSALVLSFALLAEGIARVVDLFKGGNLTEEVSAFSDSVKSSTGEITSSVGEMKASLAEEGGINLTDFLNFGGANGDSMLNKDSLMSGIGELFGGGDIQNMFSGGLTDSLTGAMGDLDMTSIMGPLGEQMGGFDFTSIMSESGAGDSLVTGLFSGVTEEGMEAPANELAGEFADTLGSSSNKSKTKSAGGALGQSGSSGASATHGMWYSSGTYVAQGLIDGVASKIKASDLIGTKLANALIEACKEQLKERSPSRVFYGIGEYVVEGLANGISDNTDVAVTSVEGMAKDSIAAATEALAAAIENDYSSPVIAPVLDLSNIAEGASRINSMFGNNRIGVDGEIQNGENRASGVTYNYTQNNYSPKALSRIEIYRQTRNQLSTISV